MVLSSVPLRSSDLKAPAQGKLINEHPLACDRRGHFFWKGKLRFHTKRRDKSEITIALSGAGSEVAQMALFRQPSAHHHLFSVLSLLLCHTSALNSAIRCIESRRDKQLIFVFYSTFSLLRSAAFSTRFLTSLVISICVCKCTKLFIYVQQRSIFFKLGQVLYSRDFSYKFIRIFRGTMVSPKIANSEKKQEKIQQDFKFYILVELGCQIFLPAGCGRCVNR